MSKLVPHKDSQGEAYLFWCFGCGMYHIVPTKYNDPYKSQSGKQKPTWRFNGDMDSPTFFSVFQVEWAGHEPPISCHCIVRDGEIIYLVGSTHALSGKRMKMRDEG